ncbi:hypothetical protein [Gallibacterium genomosp. 1]|uniref:hypothetical protein n=1 Tax=Gallibacterium genomosp. 1 TaxID=155515 RepID=UPI0008027DBC|nr:hypothetical protein [Gallibacterium genomosp. 1]OBX02204.1 hypothetical protein QV04_04000 [Gallibacterium genomosp. 1]
MSYPFINLDKAKKEDLIAHLKDYCGIEAKSGETKETLIEAILEFEDLNGYVRPYELMPASVKNATVTTQVPVSNDSSDLNTYPKVRIKIQSSEKFDGQDDVLVWINGYSYQIKRDTEVVVPEPVYILLRDSKTTIYQQEKDGSVTEKIVANYSIQFLGQV